MKDENRQPLLEPIRIGDLDLPNRIVMAPPSASAVNPEQQSVAAFGRKDTVVPRPTTRDEIRRTVTDFDPRDRTPSRRESNPRRRIRCIS